jgi:hypothetical protein
VLAIDPKSEIVNPKYPFSATLVEYNKHNEEVKERTRITLSIYGIRSEKLIQRLNKPYYIFIQNNITSQKWLVNFKKKYYFELPKGKLVESKVEENIDIEGESSEENNAWSGVFRTKPCGGFKGKKIAVRDVKNTELSVWKCTDKKGRGYIQHYSELLGFVIRQETTDGQIGELQEIKFVDKPNEYFKPSNLWREVTIEEFVTGIPMLEPYKE